ncbi:MAG: hypothetical protein QF805_13155 [Pirellulaceae bacterium]|nr:hypothetical protein [Pirellulaceae bacterium]
MISRNNRRRLGLSLMEVMISIAVLGGAIATIGELIRVGTISAERARDLTTAQLHAESKMAEIAAGVYPMSHVAEAELEIDPEWLFSVQVEQIDTNGLSSVIVWVRKNVPEEYRPASYTLTRWILDSDLQLPEEETTETDSSSGAAAGGATSGGASSGASSGGGR